MQYKTRWQGAQVDGQTGKGVLRIPCCGAVEFSWYGLGGRSRIYPPYTHTLPQSCKNKGREARLTAKRERRRRRRRGDWEGMKEWRLGKGGGILCKERR